MRLKKFLLNEAASFKMSPNVLKLISSVVSKAIGHNLYPMGQEEFSSSDGRKGVGIRYITQSGKMFRFNWVKGNKLSSTFTSVDIWNSFENLKVPDKTIHFPEDFNIVTSINAIKDAFNATSNISIELDEEEEISEEEPVKRKRGRPRKIQITNGSPETSTLTRQITISQKLLDETKYADVDTVFQDLEDLIYVVAKGKQPSLLITGMPGIGKTHVVTNQLKKLMGPENKEWFVVKGKTSTLGLYSTLFLHRNDTIVFDDCDSVFSNPDAVNLLKAALDSYESRSISWISPQTINVSQLDAEEKEDLYDEIEDKLKNDPQNTKIKYPSSFDFTGKVIFISNLASSKLDSAIKSRSMVIDITLRQEDILKRIESILPDIEKDEPLKDKMEILDYFASELKKGTEKNISMRSFILALKIKTSGVPNWQRLLSYSGN